ncbi:MAG: hypothetical protein AMXMBFR84_16460 [Candidatus Hydrogenedentota bacterium]
MPDPQVSRPQQNMLWILPILLAWSVFMVVGLYPELFYTLLRQLGRVVTQNALVNSPHFVTVALAAYYGWFTYQRCLESGMPPMHAKARGVQFLVVSSLAFLNFNPAWVVLAGQLPNNGSRIALIGIIIAKLGAWFYLCLLIFRYYMLGQAGVFSEVPADKEYAPEPATETPHMHENNGRHAFPHKSLPPSDTADFQEQKQGDVADPR